MSPEPVLTGRFAPSPTGPLHLGSLRTALAAWLFARSAGGRFLVRVEDIDPERSRASWEQVQLDALIALGIDWDGEVVRQSERGELYAGALQALEDAGRVYPCFCSRAEIRAAASAPHAHDAGTGAGSPSLSAGAYPGTCRALSATERARRIARGDRHALRFYAGAERISFTDRLAGPQSSVVEDFILRRSDGVFAYQLAVVVDDGAQGVTQVVRGADLLDSVGRQLLLIRELDLPEPAWTHVPLVLGPDGRRLAKRHGSDTTFERGGTETLRLLARSLGMTVSAPITAAELIAGFDPDQIPPEAVTLP